MARIQPLLDHYGESHQHVINKLIHWFCIPAIMLSLIGLLYAIPFPVGRSMWMNWGAVFLALACLYYLRLSPALFIGFIIISYGLLWGVHSLYLSTGGDMGQYIYLVLGIFIVAWIVQFIGHKIEGKKPSFLEDVQYLLIGPAWLLHFIYRKIGLPY